MNFKKPSPCNNCPYRTDAQLALWDRIEFEKVLAQDDQPFGRIFGCHKNDKSICRGYLMDQDRRDFPNMNLRITLIDEAVTRDYLDQLASPAPLYGSVQEMAEANYPGITRQP